MTPFCIFAQMDRVRQTENARAAKAAKRLEKLAYQQRCLQVLRQIEATGFDFGGQPLTAAKKLDFLFLYVIPDKSKRTSKLRMLFQGYYHWNDDIYLRLILDYCRNRERISKELSKAYHKELITKQLINQ